jgi:hypothetical protein
MPAAKTGRPFLADSPQKRVVNNPRITPKNFSEFVLTLWQEVVKSGLLWVKMDFYFPRE